VNSKSILVRGDYEDYLVRVYFGPRFIRSQDFLGACIDRAYLDFNRTLRGLSKFDASRALSKSAASMVKKAFGALETACAHEISAVEFDNWHRCACEGLISKYADSGYGFLKLPCSWSQLDDYDLYLDRQNWIRDKFELVPLDTEFRLWLGQEAQLRGGK